MRLILARIELLVRIGVGLLAGVAVLAPAAASANEKYAALVVDANSDRVLYSRNGDSYRYPASLTKMMTLYLTFEALEAGELSFDEDLRVSATAAGQAPSKLGLKSGEKIAVNDIVLALITKSANDAAVVVAERLGDSESQFAKMMTDKAKSLGMSRTTFRNASGLPNPGQRTTARDLATLSKALMQDFPQYFGLFATPSFTWKGRTYPNHDKLLTAYPGTTGLKTGYTAASGFNLATSVERNGYTLVGIVLGGRTAKSRDDHMIQLLDMQFARLEGSPMLAKRKPLMAQLPPLPKPATRDAAAAGTAPAARPLNIRPASSGVVVAGLLPAPPPIADVEVPREKQSSKPAPQARAPAPRPVQEAETFTPVGDPIGAAIAALAPEESSRQGSSNVQVAALSEFGNEQGDTELEPGDAQFIDWLGNNQHWGIQIGAFAAMETAAARLSAAAALAPEKLKSATPAIVSAANGGSTIYKARFGPFEETDARSACDVLSARGVSCVPVKDGATP